MRLRDLVSVAGLLAASFQSAFAQDDGFRSEPRGEYRGYNRGDGGWGYERWRDEYGQYEEQSDPARDRQLQQQELRYNRAVQTLRRRRDHNVVGLRQALDQGRISREQYDIGVWREQRQLDAGIAQQQRGSPP